MSDVSPKSSSFTDEANTLLNTLLPEFVYNAKPAALNNYLIGVETTPDFIQTIAQQLEKKSLELQKAAWIGILEHYYHEQLKIDCNLNKTNDSSEQKDASEYGQTIAKAQKTIEEQSQKIEEMTGQIENQQKEISHIEIEKNALLAEQEKCQDTLSQYLEDEKALNERKSNRLKEKETLHENFVKLATDERNFNREIRRLKRELAKLEKNIHVSIQSVDSLKPTQEILQKEIQKLSEDYEQKKQSMSTDSQDTAELTALNAKIQKKTDNFHALGRQRSLHKQAELIRQTIKVVEAEIKNVSDLKKNNAAEKQNLRKQTEEAYLKEQQFKEQKSALENERKELDNCLQKLEEQLSSKRRECDELSEQKTELETLKQQEQAKIDTAGELIDRKRKARAYQSEQVEARSKARDSYEQKKNETDVKMDLESVEALVRASLSKETLTALDQEKEQNEQKLREEKATAIEAIRSIAYQLFLDHIQKLPDEPKYMPIKSNARLIQNHRQLKQECNEDHSDLAGEIKQIDTMIETERKKVRSFALQSEINGLEEELKRQRNNVNNSFKGLIFLLILASLLTSFVVVTAILIWTGILSLFAPALTVVAAVGISAGVAALSLIAYSVISAHKADGMDVMLKQKQTKIAQLGCGIPS